MRLKLRRKDAKQLKAMFVCFLGWVHTKRYNNLLRDKIAYKVNRKTQIYA